MLSSLNVLAPLSIIFEVKRNGNGAVLMVCFGVKLQSKTIIRNSWLLISTKFLVIILLSSLHRHLNSD